MVDLAGDIQFLRQMMQGRDGAGGDRGGFDVRSLILSQTQDVFDAGRGERPRGVAVYRPGGRIRRCGSSGGRGTDRLGAMPSIRYMSQDRSEERRAGKER